MGFGSGDIGMGVSFTLNDHGATANSRRIGSSFMNMDKQVGQSVNNMNMMMGQLAAGFIGFTTTAGILLGPFVASINVFKDFEATMADVAAKAQIPLLGEQYEQLKAQSLALGEATKFSAKEVAEGQAFLAMAGFNVNSILGSMPGLLDLAAAGNLSLARASDIASNTMAQFNLDATDMAHISDVIANSAISSNQNVEQFAQGMKFLGPTASALKIPLEEAAGAMMLLANAGLQSSLGTRALGTSLVTRLTGAIPKAQEEMDKIGLSVWDATGKFVGLAETFRRVKQLTKDMTDQQRTQTLGIIFGGESIQEVTTLLGGQIKVMKDGKEVILEGADALDHFTKSNMNAGGTAQMVAQKLLDNLKGSITIFNSLLETTMIQLGAALAPTIRSVVDVGTRLLQVFKGLIATDAGQFLVKVAAGLSLVITGLVGLQFVVGMLLPILTSMATAGLAIAIEFAPIIGIMALVAGAIWLGHKAFKSFSEVLEGGDAGSGFMGFLQRIAGAVMGIIEVFKTWNGETFALSKNMRDSLEKVGVLEFVLDLSTYIVRIKEFVGGYIDGFMLVGSVVKETFGVMVDVINQFFDVLGSLGINIEKLGGAVDLFRLAGKAMGVVISTFVLTPLEYTMLFITAVIKSISSLITWIKDMWTELSSFGSSLINNPLFQAVSPLFGGVSGLFSGDDDPAPTTNPDDSVGSGLADRLRNTRFAQNTEREVIKESVREVRVFLDLDGERIAEKVVDLQNRQDDRN